MESISVGFLVAVVAVLSIGIGLAIDRFLLRRFGLNKFANAKKEKKKIVSDARKETENEKQTLVAELEKTYSARHDELTKELANSRKQLKRSRRKLIETKTQTAPGKTL